MSQVERISVPGAAMSTHDPFDQVGVIWSFAWALATAITPWYEAGKIGAFGLDRWKLPAR